MSEVQNTVEETPVAVAATEAPVVVVPEAAAAAAPAETAPQETAAETTDAAAPTTTAEAPTEAATEQPKEEAKEITPATDGVLGHKGPGLVKGLRFTKRYFYFSEEPVEAKNLAAFHQNEKPPVANPIAAWASQTGKGLLFMTKRAEDKANPIAIFNLSEITDLAKEGSSELIFKVNGHKHTFQAAHAAERDSWYAALEAKAAEATAEKEAVTSSEGYKAELERLNKPAAVEAVAKKPEAKKEETAADESAKSRSRSRKRGSIFGTLLGKKEEGEEKTEDKAAESQANEPASEASAAVPTEVAAAAATEAPVEAAAPVAETAEQPKEETKVETPAPQKSKRTSRFGNFFQKVTSPSHEKSEKEVTAAAESPAVSSTAPQLENPVEEANVQPIEPEAVTAAADTTAATEATDATKATDAAAAAETSPAPAAKEKRRTSFFGNLGMKKEKKAESSDNETDGESKSKTNVFGSLFRKPSKGVKSEAKKDEAAPAESEGAAATTTEAPAAETAEPAAVAEPAQTTEVPAAETAEPVPVASTATPVQAAA